MLDFTIKLLMAIDVLVALILIGLILMQKSKSGGGLGGLAGGGAAAEEVLGSGASSILSRATVIFSLIFLVNTLTLATLQGRMVPSAGGGVFQEEIEKAGDDNGAEEARPGPGTGGPADDSEGGDAANTGAAAGSSAGGAEAAADDASGTAAPAE
jgi:preprotein translocase subunit SecG